MDLAFGTTVREHYYRIGRLEGLEADTRTHTVHSILVRGDGTRGEDEVRRPLTAVPADHFVGDIELHAFTDAMPAVPKAGHLMLTGATRLVRDGRPIGHLVGVEIDPSSGEIVSVVGRHHWWSPRLHLKAGSLDFSVAGEIRVAGGGTTSG